MGAPHYRPQIIIKLIIGTAPPPHDITKFGNTFVVSFLKGVCVCVCVCPGSCQESLGFTV